MDSSTRRENETFEDEVRRIARNLWPADEFSGAAKIDGRERDGIFETEDCIHAIEATTSRTKVKAEEDIKKLVALANTLQKRAGTRAVRCWFITRDEPTADQRKVAERHRSLVNVLSFSQFQSRLIDVRGYLSARDNCPFGSVRDPGTGRGDPAVGYIEIQLSSSGDGAVRSPREISADLLAGKRVVILGDYGAGKSMTMRFLYRELRSAYFAGKTSRFPVFINLRDHYGQTEPSEVLERHARTIGFAHGSHLVRAWRAGYVHLLLDGFDEVTTVNIQGLWRKLQDHRHRAMEAVRKLVRSHPEGAGLALSGRAHFFDSEKERRKALLLDSSFAELSLNDFSDEQLKEYLTKSGFTGVTPQWLPSRPLLIGYLAARGLLKEIARESSRDPDALDPAAGWEYLLDRIAEREAEIEAGIDGPTVRRILERLATKARAFVDGLGPISGDAVVAAFREVCGYAPDERAMLLLQRLPGLAVDRTDSESRNFIDDDFVDACRAGDVLDFISNPYGQDNLAAHSLECAIGPLGLAMVSRACAARAVPAGKVVAATDRARGLGSGYLLGDIVRSSLEVGVPVAQQTFVKELVVPELDLTGASDASSLHFEDCFFGTVGIDVDARAEMLPKFRSCYVGSLEGRLSDKDLPEGVFDKECVIETYVSAASTTDSVLSLDLPLGVRVLLTVLKKLYERRGSGRRENALFRGLDHRSRRLVPDALRLLQREGLASQCKRGADTIWLADRTQRKRVGRMLASPSTADDPLLSSAKALE